MQLTRVCLTFGACTSAFGRGADDVSASFERFVQKYGKAYASEQQRHMHFEVFKENLAVIEAENRRQTGYKLEVNAFADVAGEDFNGERLGFKAEAVSKPLLGTPYLGSHAYSGAPLPDSVDWFVDGAVTPIKDQGSCGSCWSFSSTGALEGAWQIATGQLVSISEQQLVDCAKEGGLDGCQGGVMDPAFTYLEKRVTCTDESYPYVKKAGDCVEATCTAAIPAGGVVGFKDVAPDDTQALMEAVAQQPVSTAVAAGNAVFRAYKSGVVTQNCSADVDHAVLIVGYGVEEGVEYWKIKNSWGPAWGEEGFIRLARGVADDGECGVKVMPTYPIVKMGDLTV